MINYNEFIEKYNLKNNKESKLGENITLLKVDYDNHQSVRVIIDFDNIFYIKNINNLAFVNLFDKKYNCVILYHDLSKDEKDFIKDLDLKTFACLYFDIIGGWFVSAFSLALNDYKIHDIKNECVEIEIKNYENFKKIEKQINKFDHEFFYNENNEYKIYDKIADSKNIKEIFYKKCLEIKNSI